jgi:hypothetical protein
LPAQRLGVAALKICPDGLSARRGLDGDEPPGLAQANRRSEACHLDQSLQCSRRERIGPEAAHIAAPLQQFAQRRLKILPKARIGQFRLLSSAVAGNY